MPLTLLPVTLVLAGACALIDLWLMIRIGQVRRAEKVWVGDANSEPLVRRMRAQANFVETAPFVLILVGLIEFSVGTSAWLWAAAAAFLVARVAHPFGMDGAGKARMLGAGLTMALLLALAIWAIAIPFTAHRGASEPIPVEAVPQG